MPPIQVLILAEDALTRHGLSRIISDRDGFQVSGAFPAVGFSQNELDIYQPDILLWDLGWSSDTPVDQITGLDLGPRTRLVILTPENHGPRDIRRQQLSGILSRNVSETQLFAALRAVAAGLTVMEPDIAQSMTTRSDVQTGQTPEELTPREIEVLRLLGEGLSNKSIALRLSISEHTVKFHINALLGKLGAQSRTEAVIRASRMGLITL